MGCEVAATDASLAIDFGKLLLIYSVKVCYSVVNGGHIVLKSASSCCWRK